ncbi:glycine-rich protein DOT1-like [Zingiber officinale]|uniref:glycine-rich protein DOT1-like n=1 Tax=Zingiber officinale TaxID=94328 RepID=UPI001C4C555E|nr:glycine-rich protein DOT1-like [Zingiber officinale]
MLADDDVALCPVLRREVSSRSERGQMGDGDGLGSDGGGRCSGGSGGRGRRRCGEEEGGGVEGGGGEKEEDDHTGETEAKGKANEVAEAMEDEPEHGGRSSGLGIGEGEGRAASG